jgi:cytochrome c
MKNILTVMAIILLAACESGAGKTSASDSANPTQDIVNKGGTRYDSTSNMSGDRLIASSDCFTCHKIDQKNIGPSYKQIAEKYQLNQGNLENLAGRIIRGGKGLWGQNVMTPHPQLSQSDAQQMVRYILSLNDSTATSK